MTTENARLLYVINHMDWFWSHRLPLAAAARDQGWEVYVAAPKAGTDGRLEEEAFHSVDLPPGLIPLLWHLRRIVQTLRPDIVHVITIKFAFLTGLALAFTPFKRVYTIAGLGYLFSGEGLKPKLLRFFLYPLLRFVFNNRRTLLIFQNSDDMQIFLDRGLAVKERSHLIRGSGVDTRVFKQKPPPRQDPPLVLMPTRLVHEKGVHVFIEAANILSQRKVTARYEIAGGLTQHNPNAITKAQMESMLAGSPVTWLGHVDDMPALLASAALIVYPSYYREGVPKVLLEAAATGRPIVTTDHPGCREVVRPEQNGLLVPVKDAFAVAGAIEKILSRPDILQNMGQRSREMAAKEFDVRLIVDATLKVYEYTNSAR